MKYDVINLGCKVNRVESDSYEKVLAERGYVQADEDACLVVLNTCTVTGVAEKKTRKAVRHALKKHPEARVLVTGCASAINSELFSGMSSRIRVVPKAESLEALEELIAQERAKAQTDLRETSAVIKGTPVLRTRVGVKVQDGCDNACTYCIVHVARGPAVSRPIDEITAEVCELALGGVKEIVLSGINIGSYRWGSYTLTELLERLLAVTEPAANEIHPIRFRVSSIEPMDVSDSFVRLMARSGGRICRHLHLPLQSGDSKVLREMARPYDAEDFKALVDFIRAEIPEISLSTDIIVGFPGESEQEFAQTLEVARYCEFSKIHVFPYSLREGTPAAERLDQVPHEVRLERAAQLRQLAEELRVLDYAKRVGTEELVLVEQQGRGMSESYYELHLPEGLEKGSLVSMRLPSHPCSDSLQED